MPIYIGNQKINISGVDKVYVGSQLVYQAGSAVLDYIVLSGETTSIDRDQPFSFGGIVTAYYTNGTSADVTADATFSGYNMSTAGTYTVTVSYEEAGITATATYTLTVNKIWEQLWSGSAKMTWNMTGSRPSTVNVYTNTSLTNPSDIRITFNMSNKLGSGTTYNYLKNWQSQVTKTANWTSTKPTSPIRGSSFNPGTSYYITAVGNNTSNAFVPGRDIHLVWNTSSKTFRIENSGNRGSNYQNSGTLSLEVTKIEIYR